MISNWKFKMLSLRSIYGNEKGVVVSVALMLLGVLAVMGSAAVVMTRADIKISGNYKSSDQVFYVAQAGIEDAREVLRVMNVTSTSSFTDELGSSAGGNGVLDGYVSGTDDVPLISSASLGNGSYTVYLTNDSVDGTLNQTDSNRTVTLTSVATGLNGSKAVIETIVSTFDIFPPPASITLVGSGAAFLGNNSNAKELHGDDQCGTDPIGMTRPVVAISDNADLPGVQSNINSSKPKTYHARDESGLPVTASSHPDLISAQLTTSTLQSIKSTYNIDLLKAAELNDLVKEIKKLADTVAPGGSNASSVNVGTPGDTKVVVVTGDFRLNDHGAGILVVTGELVYDGYINYEGIVLVIGEGSMRRMGAGNGTISGGVVVANTLGPDGIFGTADDVLGTPTLNTAGGGASNFRYCSTAINNALADIPPRAVAFRHVF